MNLIIKDNKDRVLYGQEVVKRIVQTNKALEVHLVKGVDFECYVAYLSQRFQDVKEVQALMASETVDYDLLEAVSDRIELSLEDGEYLEELQSHSQD